MSDKQINLITKICPYVVMSIIREVGKLQNGETCSFLVDDPLAIKSVPEELAEYDDLSLSIHRHKNGWEIIVSRI
jgi:TusA-related sulfurtransferase